MTERKDFIEPRSLDKNILNIFVFRLKKLVFIHYLWFFIKSSP